MRQNLEKGLLFYPKSSWWIFTFSISAWPITMLCKIAYISPNFFFVIFFFQRLKNGFQNFSFSGLFFVDEALPLKTAKNRQIFGKKQPQNFFAKGGLLLFWKCSVKVGVSGRLKHTLTHSPRGIRPYVSEIVSPKLIIGALLLQKFRPLHHGLLKSAVKY